jgi:uncharacterized protein YggU (UPF0235/DUF167 family)
VRIDVRVIPRASRTGLEVRDGRLIVRVTAPPVDSAANLAVLEAMARALEVPKRALRIVRGETGRNKTIEIAADDAAVLARLTALGYRA